MKHHVHLIIYFACISVGILLCACRSSSLHSNQFKENGTFQHNYNELNTGTGTIASQVKTTKDEHGSSWKITYHLTRHKHPIPQPAYPRYRVSRLKGAKNRVKPRRKVMTLYTLRTALQRERYPVKPYKENPGQRPRKIAK